MFCAQHAQDGLKITLSNVKPNEEFSYSIVLIRGNITNYNHRHGVTHLRISNQNCEHCVIENAEITTDGKFRVAVELIPETNTIEFRYCCVTMNISLNYRLNENPSHLLKVLYIVPKDHDGCFQATNGTENTPKVACKKINLIIRLVQCLFAEMLAKSGFDRKTFQFVECEYFRSNLSVAETRQWTQNELWSYHAKEILASDNDTKHHCKYFGILASTICEKGIIKGNVALGIGDVALFGGGTLYAWPLQFQSIQKCFQDERFVDSNQLMDDSNGRKTFGGCFGTALGSICHEIGHIFDLGHTSDGIMGNDIDYVNRMFTIEKCPRDLPRRIESSCSSISLTRDVVRSTNRLTTVKKTNSILTQYHSRRKDDLTFLAENCAVLLNSHQWFNQCETIGSDIFCDIEQKTIRSVFPLVLVEFRLSNGMCTQYHRFNESEQCFQFTIPINTIKTNNLIVVDRNFCIVKFSID